MHHFWQGKLSQQEHLNFDDLLGSTIIDVGFHSLAPEGGFSIDYRKGDVVKRIVLGFTELGMWKYWGGDLNNPSQLDLLNKRISEFVNSDFYCNVTIKSDVTKLRYIFESDGKEVFSLALRDIKLLSNNISNMFTKELTEDDYFEIQEQLVMHLYNNNIH